MALKDRQRAIETTQSDYLYPVNALKKVFRGKMVSLLRSAYQQGQLFRITRANEVDNLLDKVMNKTGSIYIKPYLEGEFKLQANNRNETIILAYRSDGYTLAEIGRYFSLHYSTVSRIIQSRMQK